MAIFRCKMCGGDLNLIDGSLVCECEYCGSKQTVPSIDDDKKQKLYDRANKLRYNCDFDKAAGVFENIVNDFPNDAEGYWGLLLCKYGIEYIDDPSTGKKVPTCHRLSFDSYMDDPDFEMVMENAESEARAVYRQEAKQIEDLRKSILEVSGKEEPYDVFICYKETDENGGRTLDSVLAQDVYDTLTDRGYRIFFSRISLEDKLGTEYEPYIFAALNSAKIMLVFGTSYDNYNAIWVKNEWSRFLKLMASDKEKVLIPCYKDIDGYDIPKEFAKYQAQDMGKVGAIQDLIRGVEKILNGDKGTYQKDNNTDQQKESIKEDSLINRGIMALEDGAFSEAEESFNRVLDVNSKSADAYLGLLMVDMQAETLEKAKSLFTKKDYSSNRYWKRTLQFASGRMKEELDTWSTSRNVYIEEEKRRRLREKENQKRIEIAKQKRIEDEKNEKRKKLYLLEEQLRNTKQVLSDEQKEKLHEIEQELSRVKKEVEEKKQQAGKIGIFKAKEKKELQSDINTLYKQIDELKRAYDRVYLEEKNKLVSQMIRLKMDNPALFPFSFGRYPYDKKQIEWIILEQRKNHLLLLSKYCIDNRIYTDKRAVNTWGKSTIREWLNSSFIDEAFAEEGIGNIIDTLTEPSWSDSLSIKDKVFLLNEEDVNRYFKTQQEKAAPIDGTLMDLNIGINGWFLRPSVNFVKKHGAIAVPYVDPTGVIRVTGVKSVSGIRPAMWVYIGD